MLSRPPATVELGPVALGELRRGRRLRRKEHPDGRAAPRLALDLSVTAGLAAKSVDLAEAEAGALADVLGGEERIERARQRFRVHADARVHDRDRHIFAGLDALRE